MTSVTGPQLETSFLDPSALEPSLPMPPSLLQLIGRTAARIAARTLLPAATMATGAYIALHGAHYETQVDGTRVEVSTDITTAHFGLDTAVIVEGPSGKSQSLGGVDFPEFLGPVPMGIHATAYPGVEEVGRTIRDRYGYIDTVKQEAEHKAYDAADYFLLRTGAWTGGGLLAGVAMNELAAAAWRRRSQKNPNLPGSHPVMSGLGHSCLALAVLAAGGLTAGDHVHINTAYYKGYGMIGEALKSPNGFSNVHLNSPLLDKIFEDFSRAHACPETPDNTQKSPDELTITTYNIKRGQYSSNGIDGVGEELAKTDSDIILLQEVTPDALNALATQLDMQGIPGWTIENASLTYGDAILTRLPVEYTEFILLPTLGGQEPRGALVLELRSPVNGKRFLVADTHLTNEHLTLHGDTNAAIREQQVKALITRLTAIRQGDEAVILGGDFNERVHGAAYDTVDEKFRDMAGSRLKDAATFPANGLRFDNIFMLRDGAWQTINARRGGAGNSDHCLVSADLGMTDRYISPLEPVNAAAPATPVPERKSD